MNTTHQSILEKPFAELSKEELRAAVMEKFGGIMQFARLGGYNYNELVAAFRPRLGDMTAGTRKLLARVHKDALRLSCSPVSGYNVTPELRNKIDAALDQYVSITAFCEQHPEFTNVFISRVLSRSEGRITKKMRALCKVLKVPVSQPKSNATC